MVGRTIRRALWPAGLAAMIGCGQSCSFNCNGGAVGDGGADAPFMLLEFCLNTSLAEQSFLVSAPFTGTLQGSSPPVTFTATAQGMVDHNPNQAQCVVTRVYGQKAGNWSVVANNVLGWSSRGPFTCTGTNPGTIVFDVSSGQLQCRNTPF
jgi:hypothetical protein